MNTRRFFFSWMPRLLVVVVVFVSLQGSFFGIAQAEDDVVSGTTYFTATGSLYNAMYPLASNRPYPDQRHIFNSEVSTDGSFIFTSRDRRLVVTDTLGFNRNYFFDNNAKKLFLLPQIGAVETANAARQIRLTSNKKVVVTRDKDGHIYLYFLDTGVIVQAQDKQGTPIVALNDFAIDEMAKKVFFVSPGNISYSPQDINGLPDYYIWNQEDKSIILINTTKNGSAGGDAGNILSLSGDGSTVTFGVSSSSQYLDNPCGFSQGDLLQKNLPTNKYVCISSGIDDLDQEYVQTAQSSNDQQVHLIGGYHVQCCIGNVFPTNYYIFDLTVGTTPIITIPREGIGFVKLAKDGKSVFYQRGLTNATQDPLRLCQLPLQSKSENCYTYPLNSQTSGFQISSDASFVIIGSGSHLLVGSTVNVDPNNFGIQDLYVWDREGVNNVVTGKVTGDDGVTGLANVVVSTSAQEKYLTDATGMFTMPFLSPGTLVVTPSLGSKVFYPQSMTVLVPTTAVLLFSTSSTQRFSLSGRVTDAAGSAIANARITNKLGEYVTAADGTYNISGLPAGTYTITATLPGTNKKLVPSSRTVTVGPSATSVNFTEQVPIIVVPGTGASLSFLCFLHAETNCRYTSLTKDEWQWMPTASQSYEPLLATLRSQGYTEENSYLRVFYYDWRKPIETNGQTLSWYINQFRSDTGHQLVDIVGHSMGGLVARSYIQSDLYVGDVRSVFLVGTPHQGSPKTYRFWEGGETHITDDFFPDFVLYLILNGVYSRAGETPAEMFRRVVPSFQNMLPTYPYLSRDDVLVDPSTLMWQNTFLPGLNAKTLVFLDRVVVHNFVGTSKPTLQVLKVTQPQPDSRYFEDGLVLDVVEDTNGDGTVAERSSSLSLGASRESKVTSQHADMLNSLQVQNKLFQLLGLEPQATMQAVQAASSHADTSLYIAISGTVSITVTDELGRYVSKSGATIPGAHYYFNQDTPEGLVVIPNQQGTYTIAVSGEAEAHYKIGSFSPVGLSWPIAVDPFKVWKVLELAYKTGQAFEVSADGTQLVPNNVGQHQSVYLPLIVR